MDIADISKVSNRKRINVEAEKLREKVSRETAKIIKLKVAQDTAYWDLKEKLHQLENNHERLQQNMVEVQMQHEATSGQYQDELRLRPETLNKITSTREICDVLEEYTSRLKETMSRCKSDQEALCDAYQKSSHLVKEIKLAKLQREERHLNVNTGLQEKLKMSSEHQSQLLQMLNSSKQQADEELRELRGKLEAAAAQREELLQATSTLTRELDQLKQAADEKDKNIATLQTDMQQLVDEFNNKCDDMKNTMLRQEKDLKEYTESNESLKQALHNQEAFTNAFREKNDALIDKVSSLEEETARLYDELATLQGKLVDYKATCDILRKDVATLVDTKESLGNDLQEKSQLLNNAAGEIERLMTQQSETEIEKASLSAELVKTAKESADKTSVIEEYEVAINNFEGKVVDLEKALQDCRLTNDEKIQELNNTIETISTENKSKGETINKLINEIKMCMEVRNRLETNIDKMKKEMDTEREKRMEKETKFAKQVEHLDLLVKDKEEELSKQMSIILEIRGEKEKLQEKISRMQSTIDNIQKELTLPPRDPLDPHDAPELDDNAVPFPKNTLQSQKNCSNKFSEFPSPTPTPTPRPPLAPLPPPAPAPTDAMLYNIFSDSSMEGDGLDPVKVNRHFEAMSRGDHSAPLSLSALKRRRPSPTSRGGLHKPPDTPAPDSPLSLSQVRNEAKKGNTFFRTKRTENKLKRFKKIDEPETPLI